MRRVKPERLKVNTTKKSSLPRPFYISFSICRIHSLAEQEYLCPLRFQMYALLYMPSVAPRIPQVTVGSQNIR